MSITDRFQESRCLSVFTSCFTLHRKLCFAAALPEALNRMCTGRSSPRPLPAGARHRGVAGGLGILLASLLFGFLPPAKAGVLAANAGAMDVAPREPVPGVSGGSLPTTPRRAKRADFGTEQASDEVLHVANWAVDSGDHGGMPFVIVDKVGSKVFVFDGQGSLRGAASALLGSARGDKSVPGIGTRKLSSILPQERTTPAGRFMASLGRSLKGEEILWVDYKDALALHRVIATVPKERRLQRLESKVPLDRRITYGCINVPVSFYDTVVIPMFRETSGIVYILPESQPPKDFFGSYDVGHDAAAQAASSQLPAPR